MQLSVAGLLESVSQFFTGNDKSGKQEFVARLRALGSDTEMQCNMVLALLVGSTVELTQGVFPLCDLIPCRADPGVSD